MSRVFDTHAVSLVGQIEYGSLLADVGLGYEQLDSGLAEGDRYFVSAGLQYKMRRLSLSAEGHYGELDGSSEKSFSLGARYDIARGLSANLGYNYAKTDDMIDGIPIETLNLSEIIGPLRYEF